MKYELRDADDHRLILTVQVDENGTPLSVQPPGSMLAKMIMSAPHRGLSFNQVARSVLGQGERFWTPIDEQALDN